MDLSLNIIDQRAKNIAARMRERWLQKNIRAENHVSRAFTAVVLQNFFETDDLDEVEYDIVDGFDDGGIDAVRIGKVENSGFTVHVFQTKYHQQGAGNRNLDLNSIEKLAANIPSLFTEHGNPPFNSDLLEKRGEILELLGQGFIPRIQIVFSSNGKKWVENADKFIKSHEFLANPQVSTIYLGFERIVEMMTSFEAPNVQIATTGKAIIEEPYFIKMFVGKVAISEISKLVETHGSLLFERNVRKYLGLKGNRINVEVSETIRSDVDRQYFYFMNNGITAICESFTTNSLAGENFPLHVNGLQIVNGGQTSNTIYRTLQSLKSTGAATQDGFVLLRLYAISKLSHQSLIEKIIIATNSQTPIDLSALSSVSEFQNMLKQSVEELGLSYRYEPKAGEVHRPGKKGDSPEDYISMRTAAEAICAAWFGDIQWLRQVTHGVLQLHYEKIFKPSLNGAQLVLAVVLNRFSDSARRNSTYIARAPSLPYSHFVLTRFLATALVLHSEALTLEAKKKSLNHPDGFGSLVNHDTIAALLNFWDRDKENIVDISLARLVEVERDLGLSQADSKAQLSAAFRQSVLQKIVNKRINELINTGVTAAK